MRIFGQQFAMGVLQNPISAITGAIGGVTSLIGGAIGSSAANSAAKGINAADIAAGQKVENAAAAVNPGITSAAATAGTNAVTTAATGSAAATAAADKAAADAKATAATGAAGVNTSTKTANDLLNPYSEAGMAASGTLAQGLAPGGDFNKNPSLSDLQMDPGYAFRLAQGEAALGRSAAARSGATGGAAIKATTDFAQGSASQEYRNAFNRFETSTQNRYANLSGVANRGLVAGTTMGTNDVNAALFGANTANTAAMYGGTLGANAAQFGAGLNSNASQYQGSLNYGAAVGTAANTLNAASTAANYNVAGATAIGQGKVGAANAWTGALNGVGNAAMYGGFGNPAQSYGPPPTQVFSNGVPLNVPGSQAAQGWY